MTNQYIGGNPHIADHAIYPTIYYFYHNEKSAAKTILFLIIQFVLKILDDAGLFIEITRWCWFIYRNC